MPDLTPPSDPAARPMEGQRPPLITALAAQVISAAVVFGVTAGTGMHVGLVVLLVLQGTGAAALGLWLGLARWWLPLQLLAPPAVWGALQLPIPPWIYLAVFAGLVLVYWNSAGERVPLYLTNRKTWAALEKLLPDKPDLTFADLGSGLGGVLLFLATQRSEGTFIGLESAPIPYLLSRVRLSLARRTNLRIFMRSLWMVDLARFDVVYCFLSPAPMPPLFDKAKAEMRPGALFISNSFEVPGHPADRVIELDDGRRTRLHVWQM